MKSVRHILTAVMSTAIVSASTVAVGLASPVSAASPTAASTSLWAEFAQCPVDGFVGPKEPVNICVVSTAQAGYFIINTTILPFTGPGLVQGGFDGNAVGGNWANALNGNSFSAPPQPFPGGVGALVGNPQLRGAVNIVGEVAGPLAFNFSCIFANPSCPVLTVPLKFHLHNPDLGSNCFIGSDSNPVTLGLTPGTTNPPPPNRPITGSLGRLSILAGGKILHAEQAVFVDNSFAVPGATGCGSFGSLDSAINSAQGLPAAAGLNTVVFVGSVHLAVADAVEAHLGERR